MCHGVKHVLIILHGDVTARLAADGLLEPPPDVLTVESAGKEPTNRSPVEFVRQNLFVRIKSVVVCFDFFDAAKACSFLFLLEI